MRAAVFCIAAIFVLVACGPRQLAEYTSNNQKIDSTIVSNSLDSLISPYRAKLNEEMMQVIGHSDSNLLSYAPESPLSNFVADVVFDKGMEYARLNQLGCETSNTFCMLNFGGIRSAINKGDITTSTVYELMPFDNTIVIVQLSKPSIQHVLNAIYETKGQPISNAKMSFSEAESTFSIGQDREYYGQEDFYIITSDYLANGGDKMDFFKNYFNRWDTGILIRDVLLDYISAKKNILYQPVEGRIVFE